MGLTAGLAGCATNLREPAAAEAQIRERIASIRAAIVAKSAEGIVRWGTADWSFTGADGQTYDRAGYLRRTAGLFAQVEQIESLQTMVDRVAVRGGEADLELTQTMVRRERPAEAGGAGKRWWLRYREHQVWVFRGADGWRVRRVEFIGAPERRELPAALPPR